MEDSKKIRELIKEALNDVFDTKPKKSLNQPQPTQKKGKSTGFKGYKFGIKDTGMNFEDGAPIEYLNLKNNIIFNDSISKEQKKEQFQKILKSLNVSLFISNELENLNDKLLSIPVLSVNNDNLIKDFTQISKKADEIIKKNSISSIELKKWFKII